MDTLIAVQKHQSAAAGNQFASWIEDRRNPSTSHSHFIALQPIFDRHGRVFAYEALSRSTRSNRFTGDSRHATHGIIYDWLLDGLGNLTAGKPIFLNCTSEDLTGDLTAILPVRIIVEVLETVQVDEWVVDACRRIKAFGHGIALDDFQLNAVDHDLLPLADYVKIDFQLCGEEQRREIISCLRGTSVRLIAEKIETREEFRSARDEGFHLFQGYYLARPALLSKETARQRWLNHLRLRWLSRHRPSRWK